MRRLLAGSTALIALAAFAPPATAQTTGYGSFDMRVPFTAYRYFNQRPLANQNAMQSFAFDEFNKTILVVQTRKGHRADGGLLVNRFNYGGQRLDTMTLNGFGHGTSFGVTHSGSTTFMWLESQAKANDHGTSAGTRVSRVAYRAGRTVRSGSKGTLDVTLPGAVNRSPVPQIDRVTNKLIVRITVGKLWRFVSVSQADAVAHRWNRITILGNTPSDGRGASPQGYAVMGNYAYLNYGTLGKPNGYIRKVPLIRGTVQTGSISRENVFPGLGAREPEGITVQVYTGGVPRLWLGVTSKAGKKSFVNLAYTGRYQ